MRYLPLIILAACLSPPPGWTVVNATPEQTTQALGMVEAARTVTGAALSDGFVTVAADLGMRGVKHVTGTSYTLNGQCAVEVLTDMAALPHELCHCAGVSEAEADHCGQMVDAEYRRMYP
jgi:hypothetical protein